MHDTAPAAFGMMAMLALASAILQMGTGVHILTHGNMPPLPPTASAFLGGLLVGIAVLVQLSDALEDLSHLWHPDHVFLAFMSSPVLMFVLERCLLAPHEDGAKLAAAQSTPPLKSGLQPSLNERSSLISASAASDPKPPASRLGRMRLWLPLLIWPVRSLLGGVMLGVTSTPGVAFALAVPLTYCGVQDVTRVIGVVRALGCGRRAQACSVGIFALAFPCGAMGASTIYFGVPTHHWDDRIHVCRTIVAGMLVYIALFQLAPPHTHQRSANVGYLIAFSTGLAFTAGVDILNS